ncbi:MAG: hypothetical protein ORN49_08040 [Rhodobacteraceae bacterium]|nr:hypothetical protein [Paracoccaceae bacterium]
MMRKGFRAGLLAFGFVAAAGNPLRAGDAIANACLSAESAPGGLCDCLQQVADQTLDSGDQRKAAKLFRDPDKAEEMRRADTESAEEFWNRYSNFAQTAEAMCPAQ